MAKSLERALPANHSERDYHASDRSFTVTVGKWGGFYAARRKAVPGWRVCLGWVAFTYSHGDIPTHEAMRIGFEFAKKNPKVKVWKEVLDGN